MALEISSLSGGSVQGSGTSGPVEERAKEANSSTTSAAPSSADKVSLTSSATQLQALEDQISSLPVADPQRVEETRLALSTGSHEVNPESTAEGVLAVERSFA
jgi:negative regulator of flagellin synthesis FlgM